MATYRNLWFINLLLAIICFLQMINVSFSIKYRDRKVWMEANHTIWPKKEHKATMFFLHNEGEDGVGMKLWYHMVLNVQQVGFDHIKIVFPNSPTFPYARLMGREHELWLDEEGYGPEYEETLNGTYDISFNGLQALIREELQNTDIPWNKTVIGGLMQGGEMAMHIVYRVFRDVAGAFALSSYLRDNSIVYKELEQSKPAKLPELYLVSGLKDPYRKPEWGNKTVERLQKLGVPGQWILDKNVSSEIKRKEIELLNKWVSTKLGVE